MYSLRSLTEKLYQDGLRSKTGKIIPKTSVEKMLKNAKDATPAFKLVRQVH